MKLIISEDGGVDSTKGREARFWRESFKGKAALILQS